MNRNTIDISITPETGLIAVENKGRTSGIVEFTKEDIVDLIKAVKSTKINTGFNKQFNVELGSILVEDKLQNTYVTLTPDDIIQLGNYLKRNKDKIASRRNFR